MPLTKQEKLPPKQHNQFRSVIRLYDQKQYKRALKTADGVLKKYPDHGETLAMKGLVLNAMGKKDEGMELAKLGIRKDMMSHVTWHCLGLVHRAHGNYTDAIKCYQQALRLDPSGVHILRDLSLMQVQMRNLKGFVESRQKLLQLKPSSKVNWVSFAVAHYLSENYEMALTILKEYEATLNADQRDYDTNEIVFMESLLLSKQGLYAEALEVLQTKVNKVLDHSTLAERQGELCIRLGKMERAELLFRWLIARNPENYRYHRGLQCCLLNMPEGLDLPACDLPGTSADLSADQVTTLLAAYDALHAAQPRVRAHRRIPLDFLPASHPRFLPALDSLFRNDIRKGMPSLFMHLKPLYAQAGKGEAIEKLLLSYLEAALAGNRLPVVEGAEPDARMVDSDPEHKTTLLWVQMFAGQHFDRIGQYEKALGFFDTAIKRTPTVLDLYMWRGRTLKHAGQIKAAATSYDQGRRLDLADRYINTKCSKYMLRADMETEGDVTANLFASDNRTVIDMQCLWFEIESGEAHLRCKNYGKALKKFTFSESHFDDFNANQFDFHTYCIRQMTLRPYLDCLAEIDSYPSHPRRLQAVGGIVKAYLALADEKEAKAHAAAETAKTQEATMTPAQIKKAKKNAARKAKRLAKKQAAADAAASAASGTDESKSKDDDPDGAKLAAVEDPLAEAAKFAAKLEESGGSCVDSQLLVFKVALKRGKLLQALRALRRAAALAPTHPEVVAAKVRFATAAQKATGAEGVVAEVLAEALAKPDLLPAGQTVEGLVTAALEANSGSFTHRVAIAGALVESDAVANKARSVALLTDLSGDGITQEACLDALNALKAIADAATVASFTAACNSRFPLATAFGAAEVGIADVGECPPLDMGTPGGEPADPSQVEVDV